MPRSHRRPRHTASGDRPDRVSPHTRFSRRTTALTVFFVLVCLGGLMSIYFVMGVFMFVLVVIMIMFFVMMFDLCLLWVC